ncbi:nuclease A inhibitor family protein [Pedobacter sp. KR3-3]|uniref:Nuclease A inhibitor family protein n=1 Tax=Pedobacter albus TaxID=3113905 RepID=A0ABU7IC87_9SPHI|nr:nuclease A inhibitor family protein [Pedobacter sp. KR3-3]MEE1947069.1 nuclease A inhibitor family protein [Pedobacter sp. KR3-3]
MEQMQVLTELSKLTENLLYFSESESPYTITVWTDVQPHQLAEQIAASQPTNAQLKPVDFHLFFEQLVNRVDPSDSVLIENAKRTSRLKDFLQTNLSQLQVFRAEGSSAIPIFIAGFLPNQSCVLLQTKAIET